MNYLRFLFLFLFVAIFFSSCNKKESVHEVDAKIISYEVNYINDLAGSIPTKILPNKMELIFGEQYAKNTIEGFMGQFSLSYISNLKKEKVITLLKIFDKKYYYQGSSKELPCGINPMKNMVLIPNGKSATILGFEAKEYDLNIGGIEGMKVYTTSDIQVRNPNCSTPYYSIDEVLLQFYTKLSVLEMYLVAESFKEETISSSIFSIPNGYTEVSRLKMENTLAELFKK